MYTSKDMVNQLKKYTYVKSKYTIHKTGYTKLYNILYIYHTIHTHILTLKNLIVNSQKYKQSTLLLLLLI